MMTKFKIWAVPAVLLLVLASCKEETVESQALVSISVANAVNGGGTLKLNGTYQTVDNNTFANWALLAGQSRLKLSESTAPSPVYYDQQFQTADRDRYSLFLGGTGPSAIESVWVKDSFKNYTDSIFGLRFVNLVSGGPAIKVNVLGQASGSEVATLGFKQVSEIRTYKGDAKNLVHSFELRNALTDVVLLTYVFRPNAPGVNPIPRFKNVTLVYRGIAGGSAAAVPSILRVNHY